MSGSETEHLFTAKCGCGWSAEGVTESTGKLLAVLHSLVRHPAVYRDAVGREPEEAAHWYRAALADPEIRGRL